MTMSAELNSPSPVMVMSPYELKYEWDEKTQTNKQELNQ